MHSCAGKGFCCRQGNDWPRLTLSVRWGVMTITRSERQRHKQESVLGETLLFSMQVTYCFPFASQWACHNHSNTHILHVCKNTCMVFRYSAISCNRKSKDSMHMNKGMNAQHIPYHPNLTIWFGRNFLSTTEKASVYSLQFNCPPSHPVSQLWTAMQSILGSV